MMFTAIAHTSVTNIVLIETIEIPLGLLLAWLLYREKSNWTAVLGALCALGGVATTLILQNGRVTREHDRSADARRSGLR